MYLIPALKTWIDVLVLFKIFWKTLVLFRSHQCFWYFFLGLLMSSTHGFKAGMDPLLACQKRDFAPNSGVRAPSLDVWEILDPELLWSTPKMLILSHRWRSGELDPLHQIWHWMYETTDWHASGRHSSCMDNLWFRMTWWRISRYCRGMERGSPTSRQKVLAVDSVNVCLNRTARSSAILHTNTCMTVTGVIRWCSVKWDFC